MTSTVHVKGYTRRKPVNAEREALHKRLAMEVNLQREWQVIEKQLRAALDPSTGVTVEMVMEELPEFANADFRTSMGLIW
jgi:hypothetical protein